MDNLTQFDYCQTAIMDSQRGANCPTPSNAHMPDSSVSGDAQRLLSGLPAHAVSAAPTSEVVDSELPPQYQSDDHFTLAWG